MAEKGEYTLCRDGGDTTYRREKVGSSVSLVASSEKEAKRMAKALVAWLGQGTEEVKYNEETKEWTLTVTRCLPAKV